jgi:hypothetical protein
MPDVDVVKPECLAVGGKQKAVVAACVTAKPAVLELGRSVVPTAVMCCPQLAHPSRAGRGGRVDVDGGELRCCLGCRSDDQCSECDRRDHADRCSKARRLMRLRHVLPP